MSDTVTLPIRWRHVTGGDVIVGHEGTHWTVRAAIPERGRLRVEIRRPGVSPWRGHVDLDEAAQVLTPAPLAAAMLLVRRELGATLIGRSVEADDEEVAA